MYTDIAITTALTIQQVFHLALRQTEGFLNCLFKRMAVNLTSPDYSTLSIRATTLQVKIRVRQHWSEPLHIVVDSTGAKVYGEGEWKVRQHGWSKHRRWTKLHLGVDEKTGDILIGAVTGNNIVDSEVLRFLLDQIPGSINQVSTDGAYDRRKCYQALRDKGVKHVAIPPQHNARIWQHGNSKQERLVRDENLRRIRAVGRKRWQEESDYHRRSLAENTMFRLKTIFGDRVSARNLAGQRTQLLLRCKALNQMTMLGRPDSYLVA
ncbi:MAG: Transposase, IS4 family [Parcubacteria group bacterium GW2011_GWA2_42_28]|nr:MAG: Transposase, IS4 family [Parcubacteria group bacterium GW2011_GWA2_42_28]